MAADTITFPTFAELGRQAREIERGMLQVKPSQISGSLQSEEHFSLFPREFEDYTAAYLVSEAHKIERKIFASNYQAEIASAPAGQAQERASGPLPSDELHQFASEQPPQVQPGPAKGPSTPNIPKTAGFHLRDMLGKGGASAPPQAGQAPRVPSEIPAAVRAPGQPEDIEEKPVPEPEEPFSAVRPVPQVPAEAERQTAHSTDGPPAAEEADRLESAPEQQTAASKLTASSKISPRLRAIIEEKLRREEQKSEEEGETDIEKAPEAEEEAEQAQDEMPVMSARERLLRRLQRQGAGPAREGTAAQEEAAEPQEAPEETAEEEQLERQAGRKPPSAPSAEQEEEAAPEELSGEEQQEIPAIRKPRASSPIQMAAEREGEEATRPEYPQQEQPEKENADGPEARQEQRIRVPRRDVRMAPEKGREREGRPEAERPVERPAPKAVPSARPGSITITPIFAGEGEENGESRPPAQEEGSERMDRIRRIMDELSPDRMKAGTMPRRRAEQEEEPPEELPPAESAEVAASPVALKAKMAKVPASSKKQAQQKAAARRVPSRAAAPARKQAGPVPETFGQESARADVKKRRQAASVATKVSAVQPAEKEPEIRHPITRKAVAVQTVEREPEVRPARQIAAKTKIAQPSEEEPEAGVPAQPVPRKAVAVPRTPVPQAKTRPAAPAQGAIPSRRTEASAAPAKVRLLAQPVQRATRMQPAVAAVPRNVQARAPIPSAARPAAVRASVQPSPLKRYAPAQPEESRTATIARPRILPGGISGAPPPKTYVPPLRRKLVPQEQEEEQAEPVQQEEIEERAGQQASKIRPPQPSVQQEEGERAAGQSRRIRPPSVSNQQEEEPQEEEGQPVAVSSARARLKAGQQGIPAPVKQGAEETEGQPQTESQTGEEDAGIPRPPQARKEISGEAEIPPEQDELEVPKPPPEEAEPVPQEYEQAKEGLKRKIQQEEIKEKTKEDAEALLEAYAKENLVWLHEIYSMGGMPREDFLQQAREKMAEAGKQAGPAVDAPPNPALANLGKEIDKRYKK